MFPVTRLFESGQAAQQAVDKLVGGEVPRSDITVISGAEPDAAAKVDAAIAAGCAMSGHRRALKEALGNGRTLVCVTPDYGMGRFVEQTLDESGPVDSDKIPDYLPDDPAPFSGLFGLPVLTDGKSKTGLFEFDGTYSFGFPLLSKSPTPLSSMLGLKILSSKKGSIAKGSPVEKMSGTPAPLSSRVGLKLLSDRKKSGASAVERMSGNPAPLSKLLGLKVLTRRD
jgi:hypothetical protein